MQKEKEPTLFMSYSGKDSAIADVIESQIQRKTNNGLKISRFERVLYNKSFKKFMDGIQDHNYVLCIVSENYLKSQACMYEVGEVIKENNYKKKLLFVVIGENDDRFFADKMENFAPARIYKSSDRLNYISYWKNEYELLDKRIKEINDVVATKWETKRLGQIKSIFKNDISEFLDYLSDRNGKNFEELYNNNFLDIINCIFPNWQSKMFTQCETYSELFAEAIEEIKAATRTDYNQICLVVTISSHETGLMVFADNVSNGKQRYRLVVMNGLMSKAFSTGETINVGNVESGTISEYFMAVGKTKSELVVPIKFQGNIIGVINSESEEENFYSKKIEKRISNIANDFAIAVTRLGYQRNIDENKLPYIHI